MRMFIFLGLILFTIGCGKKKDDDSLISLLPPDSTTTVSLVKVPLAPPRPPEEIMASIEPLSLPLNTESLPRNEDWRYGDLQEAIASQLHPETIKLLELRQRDSIDLAREWPNTQLGETHYWFAGKVGRQKDYFTMLVGKSNHDVAYSLITFTPAGKMIDRLRLSEETSGEGDGYNTESVIDNVGRISVTRGHNYTEPYNFLGRESTTLYSIDNTGKFKQETTEQHYMETSVDWYSIPGAGLLSIEKSRGNAIFFTLVVGAGEDCTGEISGTAILRPDGKSYSFEVAGDPSPCALIFTKEADKITLEEEDRGCEHGVKCQFGGTYKKITTEKFSGAPGGLRFWLRKPVEEFTCTLAKEYGYEDPKFKCGVKPSKEPDPRNESWYAGPVFPKDKVKGIYSLLSDLEIGWEHGDIRTLTFTFERELSVQTIQRMFNLPRTKEDWKTYYNELYSIDYGNLTEEQIRTKDLDLLFVKSLMLTGFEHMGAGDIE